MTKNLIIEAIAIALTVELKSDSSLNERDIEKFNYTTKKMGYRSMHKLNKRQHYKSYKNNRYHRYI